MLNVNLIRGLKMKESKKEKVLMICRVVLLGVVIANRIYVKNIKK